MDHAGMTPAGPSVRLVNGTEDLGCVTFVLSGPDRSQHLSVSPGHPVTCHGTAADGRGVVAFAPAGHVLGADVAHFPGPAEATAAGNQREGYRVAFAPLGGGGDDAGGQQVLAWDQWQDLGAEGGGIWNDIAVARWANGTQLVFAAALNLKGYYRRQSAPNAGTWTTWQGLDSPTGRTIYPTGVAAATDSRGLVHVFAECHGPGSQFQIFYRRQTERNIDTWTAWQPVGTPAFSPIGGLTVARDHDHRLQLFTNGFWTIRQASPGTDQWEDPTYLNSPSSFGFTSPPRAVLDGTGRLQVFTTLETSSGGMISQTIYRTRQAQPGGAVWNFWETVKSVPNGGQSGFFVIKGLQNRVNILSGQFGNVWQLREPADSVTPWATDWIDRGRPGGFDAGPIVATFNRHGRLQTFVGSSGIRTAEELQQGAAWSAWQDLTQQNDSLLRPLDIEVGANANGRLVVFAVGGSGAGFRRLWALREQ